MSFSNTTINFNIFDVANNPIAGAQVQFVLAGILFSGVTNSNGYVVFSAVLNTITVVDVKVSADGYVTNEASLNIGSSNNQFTIVLGVNPTEIVKPIQVVDVTGAPIKGAAVSLNGLIIGKTNTSGVINISTHPGLIDVKIKALGYGLLAIEDSYTNFTFPTQFVLVSSASSKYKISVYGIPSTYVQLNDSNGNLLDSFAINPSGESTSNIDLSVGSYGLVASLPKYHVKNIPIKVSANSTAFTIGPMVLLAGSPISQVSGAFKATAPSVVGEDTGTVATNTALTGEDIPNVATITGSESDYPSEWIYPNSGTGKYFTSSQARVYIGRFFVDEVDTIYYAYQNNKIPIYGYSSADINAFGQGKRLLQGQITLNFVSEGYLYAILNENAQFNQDIRTAQDQQYDSLADLYEQQSTLQTQIAGGSPDLLPQLDSVSSQIAQMHSALGPSSINKIKAILASANTESTDVNASRLNAPFDIVIKATGGGRTTTRTLKNCVLTTNEQVFDQSDNSIKDVYGFIGVELV